jgi:RNA polymerase sigma-70 factor (ECF subfamily)
MSVERRHEDTVAEPPTQGAVDFEALVRPHLEYLYGMAVRFCGNRALAEDLVQETLLRAFRGLSGLRNRERPRLWLTTILRNCHYDRCRAEREADESLGRDHDAAFDLFDTIVEEDPFPYSDRVHLDFLELFDSEKVIEVFGRLHPAHREAVILAYVYGYTAREIAEITGAPLGTVLARLSRGRKQLERELWEYARGRKLIPEGETRP